MKHTANSDKIILDGVAKELAKPRMSKSARTAELVLHPQPRPGLPHVTVAAIVDQIIPSRPNQAERAQIKVNVRDNQYGKLRIENTLTNSQGEDLSLKKGARVDITVPAKKHTN